MKTPTFDEWLNKYFNPPVIKKMYKSNMKGDSKEYSYNQLVNRYNRAYKH